MHVIGNIMSLKELVDLILVLDYNYCTASKNSKFGGTTEYVQKQWYGSYTDHMSDRVILCMMFMLAS